jgi:hypothetical protein
MARNCSDINGDVAQIRLLHAAAQHAARLLQGQQLNAEKLFRA